MLGVKRNVLQQIMKKESKDKSVWFTKPEGKKKSRGKPNSLPRVIGRRRPEQVD